VGGRLRGPGLVGSEILRARKERVAAYLIPWATVSGRSPGASLGLRAARVYSTNTPADPVTDGLMNVCHSARAPE
jgi:hypothetical protein